MLYTILVFLVLETGGFNVPWWAWTILFLLAFLKLLLFSLLSDQ